MIKENYLTLSWNVSNEIELKHHHFWYYLPKAETGICFLFAGGSPHNQEVPRNSREH